MRQRHPVPIKAPGVSRGIANHMERHPVPIKAPGVSRGIALPYRPTFFHASCTTFFTSLPKRLESPAICTVIEAMSLN